MKSAASIAFLLASHLAAAAELPKTTPEKTAYRSTSRYDEVVAFIHALQRLDRNLRVETFATTNEGRVLPLVVAGPRGVIDPATARASRKPVVFIMANIHAGEVEGKEAAQMLLRDLVSSHRRLCNDLVILVAPIYNADGNEKISTENRRSQQGPPNGVGVRENAQGLDLNRDYMKLETPEARGLVANVLTRWDPLLTIDLHTTNGSYHGYQLTYSPPLNPNAPAEIIRFQRQTLLPEIRAAMKRRHGKETYYYGNFADQLAPQKGWYTFDSRPRFGNNYVGLRNRFTILSEAYSYIDFRQRVEVTHQFLHEILRAVRRNANAMTRIAREADTKTPPQLGVRFEIAPWEQNVPILWERSLPASDSLPSVEGISRPARDDGVERARAGERPAVRRTGEIIPIRTMDFGIFTPTETSVVPHAYVVDGRAEAAVEKLRQHGIAVERVVKPFGADVLAFHIAERRRAAQPFQKHHEVTLLGSWRETRAEIAAGSYLVSMQQPLARLAFYLLEPRSDDGLFTWNVFDDIPGAIAPVKKLPARGH